MRQKQQEIHSFDIEDAKKYGVTKAIVLYTIRGWINYKNRIQVGLNKASDGKYYYFAYASSRSLEEQMPYLGKSAIAKALKSLEEDDGVLISGCFNKIKWDKTKWFALTSLQIEDIDLINNTFDSENVDINASNVDDNTISSDITLNKLREKNSRGENNISSLQGKRKKLNRDPDKTKQIEEIVKEEPPFDSEAYITGMIADEQRHISIIGRYFRAKKKEFPTKKAVGTAIKRYLRVARDLAEYSDDDINKALNLLVHERKQMKSDLEWDLNGLYNYILKM